MACMPTPASIPSESAVTPPAPMSVLDRKSNGRAIYDPEAKRALVQQCLQPGVSVAATALRAGVNANLLRKWITKYQRALGEPLRHGGGMRDPTSWRAPKIRKKAGVP